MKNIVALLFVIFCLFSSNLIAQQTIWSETFDVAEKGFWGGGNDMSGITKWTLDASACILSTSSTYIKTVATSSGRMEAKNINGEAVWKSEVIDISTYPNIELTANVSELGSLNYANKYVKVYYSLDAGAETSFELNGQNIGNFGSLIASQNCLNGSSIQIIIRINNANSTEATIFDNVAVKYDNIAPDVLSVFAISESVVKIQFSEQVQKAVAETIGNYSISGIGSPISATLGSDLSSVSLTLPSNLTENQNYTINISNIADHCGNAITLISKPFTYSPFKLENIYIATKNEVYLEFSHKLNKTSAETSANYTINNGIGNPATAILVSDTIVHLTFTNSFVNNSGYSININNLADAYGIIMATGNTSFIFHQAAAYDLVINEIMADPSPTVNLPEYEYFEVYNRTAYDFSISNWKVKIGDVAKTIPFKNLKANSYMLFSSVSGVNSLKNFGETIGILGSTDLTNAGNAIAIISNEGLQIDSLNYSDTWYKDTQKVGGGWSIERIDPDNTCSRTSNWKASISTNGGTPGSINSVDAANPDNTAPELLSVQAIALNQLQLKYNEEPENTSALDLNNYLIDGTIKPQFVTLVDNQPGWLILNFESDFAWGNHDIRITNSMDICGNATPIIESTFSYYPGNPFDISINEIMADINPTPNVLPANKYIELYNQTDLNVDLLGWTLQIDDNAPVQISNSIINSKSHLIICSKDQLPNFQIYGNAIGILSETQLISSGAQISIYNAQGILIDYVKYSDTWYGDETKAAGGWSLERIDAMNYCGDSRNWKASIDFKGGTPGQENSVKAPNADLTTPVLKKLAVLSSYKLALVFSKNIIQSTAFDVNNYLLDNGDNFPVLINFPDSNRTTVILQFAGQFIDGQEQSIKIQKLKDFCGNELKDTTVHFTYHLINPVGVFAENSKIIHIQFSEEVEVVTAQSTANYIVSDGIGSPAHAYKHTERKNEVYLEFPSEFNNGKTYTLHIENIKDLSGNPIKPVDLAFTYFAPSYNDIVINEILFNPKPNGFDFVEIYNKSTHEVDLSKLSIASRDENGLITQAKVLSPKNILLGSGYFLAISGDTSHVKNDYPAASYDKFLQISSMPSYSDDKGVVVLLFGDTIIDEFAYSDNMHFALITNTEGISLERIDPEKATELETNWHSAAENIGYATPANQNSQFRNSNVDMTDEIVLSPETFSPNNDGLDDQVFIKYKFNEPGFVANISIYDSKGLIVKKIAASELLGTEGEFSWDGLHQDNSKARIGIYLVYFEVFNLQGEVKKYKKVCVLAGRLD